MGLFNFIFRRMCYTIFRRVDADNSGFIEAIEVEVAIYRLYNIINKRIPGWQDPPSRSQIQDSLRTYDRDGDNRLNRDEFVDFARSLVNTGPDMFFARVGRDAAVRTTMLPMVTKGIQQLAATSGYGQLKNVPLHIAAPAVGTLWRSVRALLPAGLPK